jgi:ketosteroid isomerase-like protein
VSNADALRATWAALRDGDAVSQLAVLDPEIVWDSSRAPMPDLAGVFHGHEGVVEGWRRWFAAWETITFPEPEIEEAGDKVLVWVEGQVNRGRGSGIEVEQPPYGFVWTFRDGKAVHVAFHPDRAEARSAAGLA